jgi:ethanolamine utilization protein EutP (predicted NTPase)
LLDVLVEYPIIEVDGRGYVKHQEVYTKAAFEKLFADCKCEYVENPKEFETLVVTFYRDIVDGNVEVVKEEQEVVFI